MTYSYYKPNNPPPEPRTGQLHYPPSLSEFVPALSGGLVQYIEESAATSAIRDAAFSILSVKSYDNLDYLGLLNTALAYAHYTVTINNLPRNFNTLLAAVVEWFDPYWMSGLLQANYQSLSQQMDPRGVHELSDAGRNRDLIIGDLDRFAREGGWEAGPNRGGGRREPYGARSNYQREDFGQRPPANQQYAASSRHPAYATAAGNGGRPGSAAATSYGSNRPNSNQLHERRDHERRHNPGNEVFQRTGDGTAMPRDSNRVASDMYETGRRREPVDQMARAGREEHPRDLRPASCGVIEEVGARHESPVVKNPATEVCTQADWKPSETQPYFEAFVELRHDVSFSFNRNDEIIQGVKVKEENHVIPGSPEALALEEQRRIEERFEQANAEVTLGARAIKVEEDGNPGRPEAIVNNSVALEDSLEAAWTSTHIGRLQHSPGWKLPMIYRQEVDVAHIFVDRRSYNEVIEEILKCESFEIAARRLLAARGALPRRIWKALNRTLTDMVNNMLAVSMGMGFDKADPGYTDIDSFCDDAGPLDVSINTDFNELMVKAYRDNQARELQKMLCKLSESEVEGYKTSQLGDMAAFPDDIRPEITFIASRYTLTLLDTDFDELGVNFGPSGSSMLSGHLTPLLESMAAELFSIYPDRGIARHLLRTKDGRTFEFVRGYLMNGSYLLTEVTCQC